MQHAGKQQANASPVICRNMRCGKLTLPLRTTIFESSPWAVSGLPSLLKSNWTSLLHRPGADRVRASKHNGMQLFVNMMCASRTACKPRCDFGRPQGVQLLTVSKRSLLPRGDRAQRCCQTRSTDIFGFDFFDCRKNHASSGTDRRCQSDQFGDGKDT
jgi:hypothetical protein